MRIRFLRDQVYETEGPGKGPRFSKGQVLDQSEVGAALDREVSDEWAEGFLRRWTQRGAAEEVDGRTPSTASKEEDAVEEVAPPRPTLTLPKATDQGRRR